MSETTDYLKSRRNRADVPLPGATGANFDRGAEASVWRLAVNRPAWLTPHTQGLWSLARRNHSHLIAAVWEAAQPG